MPDLDGLQPSSTSEGPPRVAARMSRLSHWQSQDSRHYPEQQNLRSYEGWTGGRACLSGEVPSKEGGL